jgi:hypothetical protein
MKGTLFVRKRGVKFQIIEFLFTAYSYLFQKDQKIVILIA